MDKNELEKEILSRLYEKGYRYIARNKDKSLYAYNSKPMKGEVIWVGGMYKSGLSFFNDLYDYIKFENEEPFDIAKKLDIVDWSIVPKDTKVLVSFNGVTWFRRYFAGYVSGKAINHFIVYADGATSWSTSTTDEEYTEGYRYCKLLREVTL